MTGSTETTSTEPLARAVKDRPARELVVTAFYGPLAKLVVRLLVRLRVPPPALVLAHLAVGLLAAAALAGGSLVGAALLLQLKTLLDNADGLLARASGRVTLLGRYLDTEADLVVNAAVFAALGSVTGEPWLALAAFASSVFLLSVGFNLAELHREVHGRVTESPVRTGSAMERALEWVYRAFFAPQDRALRALSTRRLARVLAGEEDSGRRRRATLAYHDRLAFAYLANTGLSSQLLVLALCLVVGVPTVFLWAVVVSVLPLPLLQLRRERLARIALRGAA